MVRNPNQKIYQTHIPREYILSKLDKDVYGKIRSAYDEMIVTLLDEGKLISEAITLASHTSMFSSIMNTILCKRYFRIAKNYIHEYNVAKKMNIHNQETT